MLVLLLLLSAMGHPIRGAAGSATNIRVTADATQDDQQPSLAVDPRHPARLAIAYINSIPPGRDRTDRWAGEELRTCGLAVSVDGGAGWRSRRLIGSGGDLPVPEGFAACWNPSVAFGADGMLHYLAQISLTPSDPYSHVILLTSSDGGATFGPPVQVDPQVPPHDGRRGGGDWWPRLAVDQRGRAPAPVHVTWGRFAPLIDRSSILSASVSADGRTITAPVRVSPPEQPEVTGAVPTVAPDGTLYVVWVDYSPWAEGDALGCAGCVGGYPDQQIEPAITSFYAGQGARLDYTQGLGCGNLTATLTSASGSTGAYAVTRGDCAAPVAVPAAASRDLGRSFEPLSRPTSDLPLGCRRDDSSLPHLCDPLHPSMYEHNVVEAVAGSSAGELQVAWWDTGGAGSVLPAGESSGGTPGRISLSSSFDGGRSWTTRRAVGQPPGAEMDQQHRPALSVSVHDRVDVAFYNVTGEGDGRNQDVYVTSIDHGAGPSAPVRVTDSPSQPSVGPAGDVGPARFGERPAIASRADDVLVAWTDARRPNRHQAIYFAVQPAHLLAEGSGNGHLLSVALGAGLVMAGAFFGIRELAARRRRALAKSDPRPSRLRPR